MFAPFSCDVDGINNVRQIVLRKRNYVVALDNYLSKGFPGQLHEALCKCTGMIFASNDRLFYLWEFGGSSPTLFLYFSFVFCSFLLFS